MIGLAATFLVLVHLENRVVQRDRLWKSSILATLYCDIDHTATSESRPVSRQDMERVAKSTSVSFDRTSGTLRLVSK
jgi:hypothetical protein